MDRFSRPLVFVFNAPSCVPRAELADDADAVVDDFDPVPEKWRLRRLPENNFAEFDCRFRINDVTYVIQAGGKDCKPLPVRLSTYRGWQREADLACTANQTED